MSASSKTKWKQSKTHEVTLPSGAECKIELPDLASMIKGGQVPNELLDVATKVGAGQPAGNVEEGVTKELIGQISDFHAFLVAETVVEPAITKEEILAQEYPAEDIELLLQIALRKTDFDAVGRQLGGLETVDSFRKFRGLDTGIEALLGASGG